MLKLTLMMILGLAAGSAMSAEPGASPMSEAELDAQRGGFTIPGGQEISFSASVDSFIDGALVLRSQLSWTDAGPVATHASANGAPLSADALQDLSAKGVDLGALGANAGAFVSADGQTVFLHQVGDNAGANFVLNAADGRQLRQDATINLGLPGFETSQAAMRQALTAQALADDVRQGLRP